MYWLDIIIGVPLLLYAIVGFAKGFVRSFASFAALILGVLLGMKFSNWLSTVLAQHLDFSKSIIFIISFIIIFITVIIVINIIGKILDKFIEKTVINLPNKILGLIFGFGLSSIIGHIPFNTTALPTIKTYPIEYNLYFYLVAIIFSIATVFPWIA